MKYGARKEKGSQFEREICVKLSLWVSKGKHRDLYWRSSLSGGRATVSHQRGKVIRQAGDICATAPEGHKLTDAYMIECKFYKDLELEGFLFGKGVLAGFWRVAVEAAARHQRSPLLVAKQNLRPVLALLKFGSLVRGVPATTLLGPNVQADLVLFEDLLAIPLEKALRLW
jgi:hypothetical protein